MKQSREIELNSMEMTGRRVLTNEEFLALVIIGGFVFWFGCSLLSFLLFFYF